jgi:exoribonuclease-2
MTRAQVVIADVDLLQLGAGVRVLEIEPSAKMAEGLNEELAKEINEKSLDKPAEDESPK